MAAAGDMQVRVALPPVIDAEAMRGLDPKADVLMLQGQTMGTIWRVRAVWPRGDADRVEVAIVARLDDLIAQMSHWQADSELCRFNRLTGGSWANLSPDFARVIDASLSLTHTSGGAFSPAMGRLVDRWGFGPPGPVEIAPNSQDVAELMPFCNVARLAWDSSTGRLRQPGGVSLDLSGIAKGYAVDALSALLRAMGVRHGLVEVGGELAGWGVRPDGQPWWVDLENPVGPALAPFDRPARIGGGDIGHLYSRWPQSGSEHRLSGTKRRAVLQRHPCSGDDRRWMGQCDERFGAGARRKTGRKARLGGALGDG
jgi:thiamine biosynthesis lipoprotein